MDPLVVSAQFAAFVWFSHDQPDVPSARAAARHFAEENWTSFLPCSHEGLGKLLLRIARHKPSSRSRRRGRVALPSGVPTCRLS